MAIKLVSTSTMIHLLNYRYDKCNNCFLAATYAPDNLLKLMTIHVNAWKEGVRNENLGPDKYGMFRTDDIEHMKPWHVYLGNTYGLWTNTIDDFEKMKNRDMEQMRSKGETVHLPDYYVKVCQQYRKHLTRNFMDIRNHIFDNGKNRQYLQDNIERAMNLLEHCVGGKNEISSFRFLDASIADNKILQCEFLNNGYRFTSCMLNLEGRYLLPVGFEKGVVITPKNVNDFKYRDVFDVLLSLDKDRIEQPKLIDFSHLNKLKVQKNTNDNGMLTRKEASRNLDHIQDMKKKGYSFGPKI